jgi:hypothetical protein
MQIETANAIAANISKDGAISLLILGEVAKTGSVEAGLNAVLGNAWRVQIEAAGLAVNIAEVLEVVMRHAAEEIVRAAAKIGGAA